MQHITQGRDRYFYTTNIAIGHVIILVAIKIFKVGRHDATKQVEYSLGQLATKMKA